MKHQLPNSRLLAYILSSNFNLPILHWVSFEKDVSMYKKILSSARVRRFDDFQYYGLLHGSLMTFVTARKDIYIYFFYFFTMHGDFLKRMKAFLFFFFWICLYYLLFTILVLVLKQNQIILNELIRTLTNEWQKSLVTKCWMKFQKVVQNDNCWVNVELKELVVVS